MKKAGYNVAVVGATGAVGEEMLKILAERKFPVATLKPLASSRSAGTKVMYGDDELVVEELTDDSFADIDIALFSAGGSVSLRFAPVAAANGAVVIDNTSAFRMEPTIPLVVPEVNAHAIADYRNRGIIANPNCSTIQMVVALKPIYDQAGIKRVVVSTYQAVSGTGKKAINELEQQVLALFQQRELPCEVYPHQIAFNCLPHIDVFLDNDYTKEEMKMIDETKKIMENDRIQVTATTVRVPVFFSHSESINVETDRFISADEVKELLSQAPGVRVVDEPAENRYPLAIDAAGQDDTLVGRIRQDESIANGINMWVVADNIRKGAALNAVQIAEILIREYL
ncbi:MAG: aspartate-semialdehyde dehydrogenase [Deltaproteobacteria bacterium]|nr:aspartate-semialdehyde dehydrogenase [Candidatus Anaeroferrophillus wilburensis]MBN2888073.1 aspartate-semialdehyde dehydrogenase [Deltaproteobacteria bacterium]